VFTGDTLFGAGCGRLFEGDAAMMHRSLMRLGALPGDARVYFGHEYTRANLRFAAAVSPGDPAVAARAAATEDHLGGGGDSAPSTMALERATNPFLRCAEPALARAAAARGAASADPAAVFAALRSWKDAF
jgi:hydroxyacylglutathione hydrolase